MSRKVIRLSIESLSTLGVDVTITNNDGATVGGGVWDFIEFKIPVSDIDLKPIFKVLAAHVDEYEADVLVNRLVNDIDIMTFAKMIKNSEVK